MAKSQNIGYRITNRQYQLATEKALERGYRSPHDLARSQLLQSIDSNYCFSHLLLQNHQGIKTNRDMIMDLAISLLVTFDADGDKASKVLSGLQKYS
ncbi:MAG: hypothetical protein AAF329_00045 [Cyanobacteria bacterium P01_A01_bin.17]